MLATGGPLVGTDPPALYRRQGGTFGEIDPPADWKGAIWWAWASSANDVWVVGAFGQIAHGPVDALEMVASTTSTNTTLYGAWGSAPDDVWIVGGAPRATSGPKGTILRWDGSQLVDVTPTGTASSATDGVLFKVWGSGRDDVMIVGAAGTAIRYDGSDWSRTETNTDVQLTTVHGRSATEMYAVGGRNQGVVLRWDGSTWTPIGEDFAPNISGVFVAPNGEVWVAGDSGYLSRFDGTSWTAVDTALFTQFHAVYVTTREAFGAGGILALSSESRRGFVGRYGP